MQNLGEVEASDLTNVTRATDLHANMAQSEQNPNSEIKDDSTETEKYRSESTLCPSPCGGPVSMYCKSCETFICINCAENQHLQHRDSVCTLQDLLSDCEGSMLRQADIVEQKMMPLQNALREITHVLADLDRNRESATKLVTDSFDLLVCTINRRKDELLKSINVAFEQKHSKLGKQADETEQCIRSLEDGLDTILLSMSPQQSQSISTCLEEEMSATVDQTTVKLFMRSFSIYKQVSTTLSDLYHDECVSDMSGTEACNGTSANVSSDQSTTEAKEYRSSSNKALIPCENPHLALSNLSDIAKINLKLSNLGHVDMSHAVAQRCELIGETITTGFCKAGEENSILLIAKTWSGELETTGKVETTVHFEYLGILDKRDVVTYRTSHQHDHARSAPLRKTWDGSSRLPISSFSTTSKNSNAYRRTQSRSSKGSSSPETNDPRGALKDLLFPRSPRQPTLSSTAQTVDEGGTPTVTHRIDYIKSGTYEITFLPSSSGKFRISVELYGKLVPPGLWTVNAINMKSRLNSRQSSISEIDGLVPTSPRNKKAEVVQNAQEKRRNSHRNIAEGNLMVKVGSKGRDKGQFSNPQGVSVDHLGRLLVSDSSNPCMQVFAVSPGKSREQKFLFKFGEKGRGIRQVQCPTGICGLPSGDVAVSDYDNKVVKIYGEDGKHKRNIGSGKLMGPKGVCRDQNGHIAVVDNKLCEIMIFQLNGRLITKFGSRGTEPHQLAGPHFLAVNKENFFYVSDFYNHCVKIFSSQGDCLGVIGSPGEGCGQFNGPTGLSIDSRGNIIVADWGNSRLQIFDKHGTFLSYVNTKDDSLYGPQGVTVVQEDFIAVADSGNQCVKIYRYLQ